MNIFICLLALARSILASLIYVIFTGIWSFFAIVAAFFPRSRDLETWILGTWGKVALKLFGARLIVKGLENIPEGSCLFLFNHTSFFDIFAMLAAFPDFRFGAKIELFKIPLFGPAMRRLGILPIARHRREEVFRVYQEAQERARRGERFALSPEGQRNVKETLLPFKSGPFVFAINAQMAIVPVVIKGAHEVLGKKQILPNWDRWRREITVEFLKRVETQAYPLEKRGELQEKVHEAMAAHFNQSPISRSAPSSFEPQRPKTP